LALFVVNLAAALVTACPAALNLVGPAQRPAIREASDGLDVWLVVEAFLSPDVGGGGQAVAGAATPSPRLRRNARVGVATLGILVVLAWLSRSLLSGGALSTYSEYDRFSWRRFVRGCRRWFGTFLLLGPLQAVATLLAFFPLMILAVIGYLAGVGRLGWIGVPLFGGAALLWLATMEMAYVVAVADEMGNVFWVLGRAARFVLLHPLAVGELYGLAILIWLVMTALYRWGLRPTLSFSGWLPLFSLQQVFIVIRLLLRLARLAGGIRLYQGRGSSQAA
jgi:hypothetical protein